MEDKAKEGKDKLTKKSVGIIVEIESDSYLVYVIYTTNLFLYLYGLFFVLILFVICCF